MGQDNPYSTSRTKKTPCGGQEDLGGQVLARRSVLGRKGSSLETLKLISGLCGHVRSKPLSAGIKWQSLLFSCFSSFSSSPAPQTASAREIFHPQVSTSRGLNSQWRGSRTRQGQLSPSHHIDSLSLSPPPVPYSPVTHHPSALPRNRTPNKYIKLRDILPVNLVLRPSKWWRTYTVPLHCFSPVPSPLYMPPPQKGLPSHLFFLLGHPSSYSFYL